MTLIVLGTLGFVVFSLAQALSAMASGPDQSGRVVRALTWRVGLSVLVFGGLMISWWLGLVEPHG